MNAFEKYRQFMITEFLGAIEPLVVAGGDGATLTDDAWRQYVDAFAGIPVCNAGHCNPGIAAALKPGDHLSTFGGNPVCCAAALEDRLRPLRKATLHDIIGASLSSKNAHFGSGPSAGCPGAKGFDRAI